MSVYTASLLESETHHHTLSDGRTLAYCIYGDPQGVPIFYAHGGPGSRLEGSLFHQNAKQYGFCFCRNAGFGVTLFRDRDEAIRHLLEE